MSFVTLVTVELTSTMGRRRARWSGADGEARAGSNDS